MSEDVTKWMHPNITGEDSNVCLQAFTWKFNEIHYQSQTSQSHFFSDEHSKNKNKNPNNALTTDYFIYLCSIMFVFSYYLHISW